MEHAPYPEPERGAPPGDYDRASAGGPPPPHPSASYSPRLPLHINVSSPAPVPVTAQSYIPGPRPVTAPSVPQDSAPTSMNAPAFVHPPTVTTPLLAALGPPASYASTAPADAAQQVHHVPAPPPPPSSEVTSAPAAEPQPHSFDDCPACRAEYAAAIAASLNTDAERRRADEERERRELEDAIRLSEQETHARPTAGADEDEDEDELLRQAIEESARNAAVEEERRRQWRQDLQRSLGEGSSSSAATGASEPLDEEELLRRVLEESARAEEEARKRREQADAWEANILERTRRTAELVEQQRYLEMQEASMWRSPDAGSSRATHASAADSLSPAGSSRVQNFTDAVSSTRNDATDLQKGKDDEDYSLGLGLRASRRSQDVPNESEFAKAIADEVRNRMGRNTLSERDEAPQHAGRVPRSQAEEDSFWRRPEPEAVQRNAPPSGPRITSIPESSVAHLGRLAEAAAGSDVNTAQTASIPPVQIGHSTEDEATNNKGPGPDVPESIGGSIPPPLPVLEPHAVTQNMSEAAIAPRDGDDQAVADANDREAPSSLPNVDIPRPTTADPPTADVGVTSASRPLPIPPGPPPAGTVPAFQSLAVPMATVGDVDSVDTTLVEQLQSAAALKSQLSAGTTDTPIKQTPPSLEVRTANEQTGLSQDPQSHSSTQDWAKQAEQNGDGPPHSAVSEDTQASLEPELCRSQADAPVDVDADSLAESESPSAAVPASRTDDDEQANNNHIGSDAATHPISIGDAPPSYAVVDPDPDASSRATSVLSHNNSNPPGPTQNGTSSLDSASMRRLGSGTGSLGGFGHPISRTDSSASSAAAAAARRSLGASPLSGGGINPLLAGMTYSHNIPAASLPSATIGPTGASSGSSHRQRWSTSNFSAGGGMSGHGGSGISVHSGIGSNGGNAFVQSGSAAQSAGPGRWAGEPQIAVALRRSSVAVTPGVGNVLSQPSQPGSASASHTGRTSIGSSTFSNGASPSMPSQPTFNPLFSAFGAEGADASRSASAAAALAPRSSLPRDHLGGWAGVQPAGPLPTSPQSSSPSMGTYAPGSGPLQFSPISAQTSPPPAPTAPDAMPAAPDNAAPAHSGLYASASESTPSSAGGKAKKKLKSLFSRHERTSSKSHAQRASMSDLETIVPYSATGATKRASVAGVPPPTGGPRDLASSSSLPSPPACAASIASPSAAAASAAPPRQPWLHAAASGSRTSLASAFSNPGSLHVHGLPPHPTTSLGPPSAMHMDGLLASGVGVGASGSSGGPYPAFMPTARPAGPAGGEERGPKVEETIEELSDSTAALP